MIKLLNLLKRPISLCKIIGILAIGWNIGNQALAHAYESPPFSPFHVELLTSTTHLGKNTSILMGIKLNLNSGWHMYAPQKDSSFTPPYVKDVGSINIQALQLLWPKAQEIEENKIKALTYEGDTLFPLIVSILSHKQDAFLKATFSFVACHTKGQCIPFTVPLFYTLEPGDITQTTSTTILQDALKEASSEPQKSSTFTSFFQTFHTMSILLLGAFVGGFLLNFMPCVLPVLSIKIFSLLKKKASMAFFETHHLRLRFLISFLGIFSFFILFSLITIIMKRFGHTLGWGFQFQQPIFLFFMVGILSIFGLNLWGFFEINLPIRFLTWMGDLSTRLTKQEEENPCKNEKENIFPTPHYSSKFFLKDFFSGLLTAVLATPCTAPFLGVALGASLTQSYLGIFLIFLMIGMGLGFPYLLLLSFPQTLKILPKPGTWMEKLKKALAIGLWGTALWLSFILLSPILITDKSDNTFTQSNLKWHPFKEEDILPLLHEGKSVLVNITASWCLTCKANEFLVFEDKKTQKLLEEKEVHLMQGDWTRPNSQIQLFLKKYHRAGIPFTIYYSPRYPTGIVLPELLTTTIVEEIINSISN